MRNNIFTASDNTVSYDAYKAMVADSMEATRKAVLYFNSIKGGRLTSEDCEDVLSTALCKCLEAYDHYDPNKGKVSTLLNKIAFNETMNALSARVRYMTRENFMDDDYLMTSGSAKSVTGALNAIHHFGDNSFIGDDIMEMEKSRASRLKIDCLKESVGNLSDRDGVIVYMLCSGYSGKRMAEELNISETACRKLVHDTRKRLSARLAENHYSDIEDRRGGFGEDASAFDGTDDDTFGFFFRKAE